MHPSPSRAGLSLAVALAAGPAAAQPAPAPGAPAASAQAPARAARVVLITAASDDEVLREAATRLQAELRAAGFEVVLVDRDAPGAGGAGAEPTAPAAPPEDLRASLERAARDAGAFAAARASRAGGGAAVDLWIADRGARPAGDLRVSGGGASTPSVVAVRAAELLQASLLEARAHRVAAAGGAPAPPGEPAAPRPAPAPPKAGPLAGVALAAGALVLQSADGIGPALGPALRLSLGPAGPAGAGALAGRLTLAGPAAAPALSGAAGEASVRQELALLELVYAPPADGPVVPVFSAGAGAYHLRVAGAPDPPLQGETGDVWAALAGAGAGAAIRITDRVAAMADVQVLVTQPRPVVRLAGETLGTAGRPTFAGFLGILARL